MLGPEPLWSWFVLSLFLDRDQSRTAVLRSMLNLCLGSVCWFLVPGSWFLVPLVGAAGLWTEGGASVIGHDDVITAAIQPHAVKRPKASPIRTTRSSARRCCWSRRTLNEGEVMCPAGSVGCVKKTGAAAAEGNSSNYKTNYQMLMMPIGFA